VFPSVAETSATLIGV